MTHYNCKNKVLVTINNVENKKHIGYKSQISSYYNQKLEK